MSEKDRNPFLEPALVSGYESWYETVGRRADRLEKALLRKLLTEFSAVHTVLDVGCGTGHFARWFRDQGLDATGLDASPAMLVEARRLQSPPCVQGDALNLPFEDQSFDLVTLITVLEFVDTPRRALQEATRVARVGLLLGALNRESELGRDLAGSGEDPWKGAHFFSPDELFRLARDAAGERVERAVWRTTLWPSGSAILREPGGGFIGIAVHLAE